MRVFSEFCNNRRKKGKIQYYDDEIEEENAIDLSNN